MFFDEECNCFLAQDISIISLVLTFDFLAKSRLYSYQHFTFMSGKQNPTEQTRTTTVYSVWPAAGITGKMSNSEQKRCNIHGTTFFDSAVGIVTLCMRCRIALSQMEITLLNKIHKEVVLARGGLIERRMPCYVYECGVWNFPEDPSPFTHGARTELFDQKSISRLDRSSTSRVEGHCPNSSEDDTRLLGD